MKCSRETSQQRSTCSLVRSARSPPTLMMPRRRAASRCCHLSKVADGYETKACAGSHEGAPTSEEHAFFGTTSAPTTRQDAGAPQTTPWSDLLEVPQIALAGGAGFLRYCEHTHRPSNVTLLSQPEMRKRVTFLS